jgi:uncharacterized protein (TIGR02145 family)
VTFEVEAPTLIMQEIIAATCPTVRTLAYDARDNHTYWVQELDDGECWMLTNLAYAGGTSNGGTNTYGDTKTITNSNTSSYTDPYYMIPTGANPTTNPTTPSTSTDGGATNPQYGYLYNWCAAMGAKTTTSACMNTSTPAPNTSISVCPSGWRLPTGNTGGESQALNNAVNSGSTTSPAGLLSTWLGMYSGYWNNNFLDQDSFGYYWSSTQDSATYAYTLYFNSLSVNPSVYGNKQNGFAVRCILEEPAQDGTEMQQITIKNCPTSKIRGVDARNNRTYWVQKLADGRCWMLTNLAYAGGGTNTYGDTKSITNSNTVSYTAPYYMIPTDANPTTEPTNPSTSTLGGTTADPNKQYGYLYNWCAAMGAQTSTSACANATTPAPNTSISVCPSGWRLPTSGIGGEFQALNTAINSGSTASDSGLRSTWLGMYSGTWLSSFIAQGSVGYYWSSTQYSASSAYLLNFGSSYVYPLYNYDKRYGFAVRCVAV